MKLRNIFLAMGLLAFIGGCTKAPKADTPEGALQKYVTTAFAVKSVDDKQKLMDLSTGDALAYLQSMGEEAFKKQFVDTKLQFVSMQAKDVRQDVTGDVSLVYELTYKEGKGNEMVLNTNKKIAYLTRDAGTGEWKIKATKNLKSFVERKEDLVVTPETTDHQVPTKSK
jgi:hypothetical protein